jgi:hypothetical protein
MWGEAAMAGLARQPLALQNYRFSGDPNDV